jgi:hypothetical protein
MAPDVMCFQDAWQDWLQKDLKPAFVSDYAKVYKDRLEKIHPGIFLTSHADIGSKPESRRSVGVDPQVRRGDGSRWVWRPQLLRVAHKHHGFRGYSVDQASILMLVAHELASPLEVLRLIPKSSDSGKTSLRIAAGLLPCPARRTLILDEL